MPMFRLSYMQHVNDVHTYHAFATKVEAFNEAHPSPRIYVSCNTSQLDAATSKRMLARVDSLSAVVNRMRDSRKLAAVLIQRAIAETVVQDFNAATSDLTASIGIDSTMTIALWQRAYCQSMLNDFDGATSKADAGNNAIKSARVLADLDEAVKLDADNQYLYYNRGCIHFARKDFTHAIDNFTHAINIDHNLAEAYYNRGLARVQNGLRADGIADLSKAGELGLYGAYSVIKQLSTEKK